MDLSLDGEINAKRSFDYSVFFDQQNFAIEAGKEFHKCVLRALLDVANFSKMPGSRVTLLGKHGVEKDYLKKGKTIAVQRRALVDAMCAGKSSYVETRIAEVVLDAYLPPDLRKMTVIKSMLPTSTIFNAKFTGKSQSFEKEFHILKHAIKWLSDMAHAESVTW